MMRFTGKLTVAVIALVALFMALPVQAQDGTTQSLTFDGFSFQFDESVALNVNITQFPGDPVSLQQPGGPEVAHTQFLLYNELPAPEGVLDGAGSIRVYRTADFSGYEFPTQAYQQLQTFLAQRPDLTTYTNGTNITQEYSLPFLPSFPASQVIRGAAQYVQTSSIGISYITVYRQDASPFLANEFLYTFQGISTDGSTYVSAIFPVTTTLFPTEFGEDFDYDAFAAAYDEYIVESSATLNTAAPTDFTPSLTTLNTIISSFTVTGTSAAAPTAIAVQPTVAPVQTTPLPTTAAQPTIATTPEGDPTLGGLAGTWRLVSYGAADAPQPVLENSEIILTISPNGVTGSGGCNSYNGAFQYELNTVSFTNVTTTEVACADPAITQQETAYLTALQTTSTFTIVDQQLQIVYEGGVLTFTAVQEAVG
jgi:heat shock protein HslJ